MTLAEDGLADARSRALSLVDAFVREHTGLSSVVPDLTLAEMGLDERQCATLVTQLARSLGRDERAAGAGRRSELLVSELIASLLGPRTG